MKNNKVFQDTVHGYISIPADYCKSIIDTEHFQRLRRVEQTSMRALYPSARHDRFIHSLGTYYLGNKAFLHLKTNSFTEFEDYLGDELWSEMQRNFELACLLHDCGHSPFSHTFEKYYDLPACLDDLLAKYSWDEEFKNDLENLNDAKQHEKVSALLVITTFKEILEKKLGANPIYMARMILGCKFSSDLNDTKTFINCFVNLLHGEVIDVDRLDYVSRDKWASGFSSSNVDVERLLSAMCLKRNAESEIVVCFKKNALSELQSVLDVKDFQNLWIFNHHKIKYEQYLLIKAVEKLAYIIHLTPKNKDVLKIEDAINNFFNVDTFFKPVTYKQHSIYLPTDDDIIHLMKNYYHQNEYAREWLSRKHKLSPVWKTYAEYNDLFSKLPASSLKSSGKLDKNVERITIKFLQKNGFTDNDFVRKIIEPSITNIEQNQVNVFINDNVVSYNDLKLPKKADNIINFFFYLYIPKDLIDKKQELIDMLIKVSK